jgi:chromosome segregation ATPase
MDTTGRDSPAEAVDDYDPAPPPPPPDLRDWASPEQLLEIGRLMDQLQHKHRVEADELRAELHRVVKERDGLAKEVARFERTASAVRAMRMDAERARTATTEWTEERAALVLRVQQLTNEVLRLRASRSSGSASVPSVSTTEEDFSRGAAFRGPAATPAGGVRTSASGGGSAGGAPVSGSTTTTASFLQAPLPSGPVIEELRVELLATMEATFRESCLRVEAERRLDFLTTLNSMQLRACELRAVNASRAAAHFEVKARTAQEAFEAERATRNSVEAQYDQAMRMVHEARLENEAAARRHNYDSEGRVGKMERAVQDAQEKLDQLNAKHRAEVHDLHITHERFRDEHLASSAALVATKQAAIDHLSAENEALADELASIRREAATDATRLHDDASRARQDAITAYTELERMQRAFQDASEANATSASRVDELHAALTALRVEHDRNGAEFARLRARYDEATQQLTVLDTVRSDRELLLHKFTKAQEDVSLLHAAHERFARESTVAASLLQQQAHTDAEAARRRAQQAEEKAAAAAVRAKRAEAERDLIRQKLDAVLVNPPEPSDYRIGSPHSKLQPPEAKATAATAPIAAPRPIDLLELLQSNVRAAVALNRGINGGHHPPSPTLQ